MSRLDERIENFNKSFNLFETMVIEYRKTPNNDVNKLALFQSFEIVVELGWKVLKDFLGQKGILAYSPNDVIKEAFAINILPEAQLWIDMVKDRNVTSHEYNLDKVDKTLSKIEKSYYAELKNFKERMEFING